ncbi:MAG TPA: hypothetical protein VGF51_10285 [Acidimicrobiales bacterium]
MLSGPRAVASSLVAWTQTRPTTEDGGDRSRTTNRWWLLWSCLIAVAVLVGTLISGNTLRHQQAFSVLDESAHYDYVLDLSHGHLPRSGDHLSQETMRAVSCLGAYNLPPHGCRVTTRNAANFPAGGYSYEAVDQPPVGYLPYLLTVRSDESPHAALVSARWGGFIWSVIAAIGLVSAGWLAALSLLELCAILSISLLGPTAVNVSAVVTNDSSAVAAGAFVLVTYLVARRLNRPLLVIGLLVGALVGLMKGLFVVAPFTLLVGVILADIAARRRLTKEAVFSRYGCVLAMTVGAIVGYVAWLLLVGARETVSTSVVLHALQGFSTTGHVQPSTILTGIQSELSGLVAWVPAPLFWVWNLAVYGSLAGMVVLQGPVGRPQLRAMAAAVFVGILALAVAFPVFNFAEGHYNFAVPTRYALPLLPIIGYVVARAMRGRGLLLVGVVLPALAVFDQVHLNQF